MKTEEAKPYLLNDVIEDRADVVGIFRDPRDVAASLMEFRAAEKNYRSRRVSRDWKRETALAIGWQNAWESMPNAYMTRYENHRGDWAMMVCEIGCHLGIPLSIEEGSAIAEEWTIPKTKDRIQQIIDDDLWLGQEWLLTRAHIGAQKGKIGRWVRDLSRDEALYVEALAGKGWMASHGYRILDNNG
jgi:hypothetical protein